MVRTRETVKCLIKYVDYETKELATMEREIILPGCKLDTKSVGKMFGLNVVDVTEISRSCIRYYMPDDFFYANATKQEVKFEEKVEEK